MTKSRPSTLSTCARNTRAVAGHVVSRDDKNDDAVRASEQADDQHDQEKARHRLHELGASHQHLVDRPATHGCGATNEQRDERGQRSGDEADDEGRPRAVHDAREQIASKIVGAEQMRTARTTQCVARDRGGVIVRKPWGKRCDLRPGRGESPTPILPLPARPDGSRGTARGVAASEGFRRHGPADPATRRRRRSAR